MSEVLGASKVIVWLDRDKGIFCLRYGMGLSSFSAVLLDPSSLKNAMTLGKEEGINISPTESGSRWQQAGLFAAYTAQASDDLGDRDAALKSAKSTQQ